MGAALRNDVLRLEDSDGSITSGPNADPLDCTMQDDGGDGSSTGCRCRREGILSV